MKHLFVALFQLPYYFSFSQNPITDTSASFMAYWKKGETKILSIIHGKEVYELNKLKSKVLLNYEANISVLDSTATGFTIQWIFHLPEEVKKINPSLVDSFPIYEGMKMIFTTSKSGSFLELINWQDVMKAYVQMMELSLPKNLDSAGKAAVTLSKELFNSRKMVEASLIKEIQLFHAPYGLTFTTNEVKSNTELENPFSKVPLPAVQTFKITELRPKQDFKLNILQEIDKSAAGKVFEGILKKMNIKDDVEILEAKKMLSSLEMREHTQYYFLQNSGWQKQINYKRGSKTSQMTQTEFYIMKMKN